MNGQNCEPWWMMLGPAIRKGRAENHDPTFGENFEWLAGAMAEDNRRAGAAPITEASVFAGPAMAQRIAYNLAAIRIEQALRTVIVASPEAVPTAPPPTPVVSES